MVGIWLGASALIPGPAACGALEFPLVLPTGFAMGTAMGTDSEPAVVWRFTFLTAGGFALRLAFCFWERFDSALLERFGSASTRISVVMFMGPEPLIVRLAEEDPLRRL